MEEVGFAYLPDIVDWLALRIKALITGCILIPEYWTWAWLAGSLDWQEANTLIDQVINLLPGIMQYA